MPIGLTVNLGLPDGVAESETGGHHVEHRLIVASRTPPGEDQEQAGVERRPGNHDVDALDVLRHVTDDDRRDRVDSAETHQHEADLVDAESAVDVVLFGRKNQDGR